MQKRRQRDPLPVACALCVFALLQACSNPAVPAVPDSAATAVAAAPTLAAGAQTGIVGAQTAVAIAQTALPGAQATVQAGATLATGVLASPQLISQALGLLLAGANVSLETVPPDATGDAVQQVTVSAIDNSGAFGRLDAATRRQSANGALLAAAQAFPRATIVLTIKDSAGTQLLSASKAPGADPVISQ